VITIRDVADILSVKTRNETEYSRYVLEKLLDRLGIPDEPSVRLQQFRVDNPFGDGDLRLDFLIVVDGSVPMVVIEAKRQEGDYDKAREEAINYARNFTPREKGVRKMTPPFVLAAAGRRVEMLGAAAKGIEVVYEPVLSKGQPAFLEWTELVRQASAFKALSGKSAPTPEDGRHSSGAIEIEIVKTFLDDLHATIYGALRKHDDERVRVLNRILLAARQNDSALAMQIAAAAKLSQSARRGVRRVLEKYEASLRAGLLAGPAAATGYRDFITMERSAGGLDLFTGDSQSRPYRLRGKVHYRETARYFTPTEIIREMVRLADPKRGEAIIDMSCGSGGFLAEVAMNLSRDKARPVVPGDVVGIDDDPFCVDVSKTVLRLVMGEAHPRVFLHNALYREAPPAGEVDEDSSAEPFLEPDRYDLVIGNPPGNKTYSGTNHEVVEKLWQSRFGITKNLWDCTFFVRRALDLARPDGGRICLLLPESFFANAGMESLRRLVLAEARPLAIISVPKVFRNSKAAMAILYARREGSWLPAKRSLAQWRRDARVFLAELHETEADSDGTSQLPSELRLAVDRYLSHPLADGKAPRRGLHAFGRAEALLSGLTG
jgi:hypothetical protein